MKNTLSILIIGFFLLFLGGCCPSSYVGYDTYYGGVANMMYAPGPYYYTVYRPYYVSPYWSPYGVPVKEVVEQNIYYINGCDTTLIKKIKK